MKSNASLITTSLTWLFLIVSIVGFLLCAWAILPLVARSIDGEKVQGNIISMVPLNDEYKLQYTYTNHYQNKAYNLIERIDQKTYTKIKERKTIDVVYNRFFPKRVFLPLIENDSYSIVVLIIGLVSMSILFYRSSLVIGGKLSINQFIGVKH